MHKTNVLKAVGAPAGTWGSRLPEDAPYIVCDPAHLADAFIDVVESRRNGLSRGVVLLCEHPRTVLLRAIANELTGGTTYDVFMSRLAAFARGNVSINNQPQSTAEANTFNPATPHIWDDVAVTADKVLFRSRYEYELALTFLGSRAGRVGFYAPDDPRVPTPQITTERTPTIAIWATDVDAALVRMFLRMTSDIQLNAVIIRDEPVDDHPCIFPADSAQTLGASRLIVSLSDDPGTARSLARFKRPLCAATHGAAEYVAPVQTFDIWNAAAAVDAMLRGLTSPVPAVIQEPQAIPSPGEPVCFETSSAPLVTIVMTVYDRLNHLRANLERLQRQTYPNIEIVVVSNNGPRADDICASFPNVRYIHRDTNSGEAGQPRTDGIAAARGEFIATLDDDDLFFDDHVASMVKACEGGLDVVYSNFLIQIVDPQSNGTETLLGYDIEKGVAITPNELMIMNRIGYLTMFVRKSLYDRIGSYNVDFIGGSEVELWLRMSSHTAMGHVERPTTVYTIRQNWKGSLTAPNHSLFIEGYKQLYTMYPAGERELIEAGRAQHLASLNASNGAASRPARYLVTPRSV